MAMTIDRRQEIVEVIAGVLRDDDDIDTVINALLGVVAHKLSLRCPTCQQAIGNELPSLVEHVIQRGKDFALARIAEGEPPVCRHRVD
jgi:hypothetical protein